MILSDNKLRPVPHSKLREKIHLRIIYASGGGLLVAPVNAPRLLHLTRKQRDDKYNLNGRYRGSQTKMTDE